MHLILPTVDEGRYINYQIRNRHEPLVRRNMFNAIPFVKACFNN